MPTLYEILEVDKTASIDDIKKSYKKLALKYHPDKNHDNDTSEKFKEISHAYEILSDEQKRKYYDITGNVSNTAQSFSGPDIPEIFQHIFRSTFSTQTQQRVQRHTIDITLEDLYLHTPVCKDVVLDRLCKNCDGTGSKSKIKKVCQKCNGRGSVFASFGNIPNSVAIIRCPECNGTKTQIPENDKCDVCKGNKLVEYTQRFTFKDMYTHNKDILIKGCGDEDDTGEKEDIIFKTNIKPNKTFILSELNLHTTLTIGLGDALTGYTGTITRLDGSLLTIEINNIITPDYVEIIKGEGINKQGDLFIKFNIKYPERINKSNKKLLKAILQD